MTALLLPQFKSSQTHSHFEYPLSENEPDLNGIIDKTADFLIDNDDFERAAELFTKAETAFPKVILYPRGLGYCYAKQGLYCK